MKSYPPIYESDNEIIHGAPEHFWNIWTLEVFHMTLFQWDWHQSVVTGVMKKRWNSALVGSKKIFSSAGAMVELLAILVYTPHIWGEITLPETNIAPENGWLEY